MIDLNRAGNALMEIVSEPDMTYGDFFPLRIQYVSYIVKNTRASRGILEIPASSITLYRYKRREHGRSEPDEHSPYYSLFKKL